MNKIKLLAISMILSSGILAQTQPQLIEKVEAKTGEWIIPYEKWKLPNGLTVIIHEDHSDPIAFVGVGYHVGSARESLGKSGFAHFFEHMMFDGSDNVKEGEHFAIVEGVGGQNNAFTTPDMTFYYEVVPSNSVETALWLEADRMGFFHDAITRKGFENQRKVVKKEKSLRDVAQPYGLRDEIKGQNLYPYGHPYSWPVIGYTDDLNRAGFNDLKTFFLRWYSPNNAILTVAGDVNPKEVLEYVVKYFGSIPKGPEVQKQRVPLLIVPEDRYANSRDNIYNPLTYVTFPGAPLYHRDEPALTLLAVIMGQGNNSIFYKKFVKSKKAADAFVFHSSMELAGEFSILVFAYPNLKDGTKITFNDIENLIRETLEEFEKTGITDDALLRAKAGVRSSIFDQPESISQKASFLNQWEMFAGRKMNLQNEIDRYKRVTKEDLVRVFNRYIKGRNALFVNIWPLPPVLTAEDLKKRKKWKKESYNPSANIPTEVDEQYKGLVYNKAVDNFDRSKKPESGPSKPAVIPEYFKEKFDNGIEIIGTKATETPKITLEIRIKGGQLLELEKGTKPGAAWVTANMMNEGTQNFTTEEISAQLERLGSTIGFSSSKGNTGIYVNSFKENLDATLKILEEKLLKPGFIVTVPDSATKEDFKRVKKQALSSVKSQKNSPQITASKVFNKLMYGESILGSFYTGTYKEVLKIKLDDVKSYYEKYYSPTITTIVVVGDISQEEIIAKLAFLKKWKAKEVNLPDIAEDFPKIEKTKIYVVHQSDFKNMDSFITIGYLANPFDATGTYFKTSIMNHALGGNFNSRINSNLREDKGWTYGAYSGFRGSEYPGPFLVSTQSVESQATDSAIVEIMKEINNYKNKGITDEEFDLTKNNFLQRDVLNYETASQKANYIYTILKYDLPNDFKAQQAKIVKNLTKDEINQLAKEHLKPDNMVILVVGNKYLIRDQINALGYGKLKELDKEGNKGSSKF